MTAPAPSQPQASGLPQRAGAWAAVLADMIEGVVAANRLQPPHADRLRADLWQLCGVEPMVRPTDVTAPIARVA